MAKFDEIAPRAPHAPLPRPVDAAARAVNAFAADPLGALARWKALSDERRALRDASAETLRDIGVSRGDADLEARRPFWDAPSRR